MVRTIDRSCPKVSEVTNSYHPDSVSKTYTIQVITPLFGGGVEPGVTDKVTLIRPSTIRGHLRFWWRATRGARCANVQELRQREGEIWGSTDNPSLITIAVENVVEDSKPVPTPCACYRWNSEKRHGQGGYDMKWLSPLNGLNSLPYALFPFQGKPPDSDEPQDPALMVNAATFNLTVCFPTSSQLEKIRSVYNKQREKKKLLLLKQADHDVQKDLEAAIWAWVNFGGIGARSRRGCGALYCSEFAPPALDTLDTLDTWFKQAQQNYRMLSNHSTLVWPTLQIAPLTSNDLEPPLQAWNKAVALMRSFRQGEVGRNMHKSPPGRSYWPEADSLRAITKLGKKIHLASITLPDPIDPNCNTAFPRAELGLPIVFHFPGPDSPNNCELYPRGKTRMGSPIILRPLAIGDGHQAVAMVLVLATLPPDELELTKLTQPPALTAHNIRRADLSTYPNSPLGPPSSSLAARSNTGSALEAFLSYARDNGFK